MSWQYLASAFLYSSSLSRPTAPLIFSPDPPIMRGTEVAKSRTSFQTHRIRTVQLECIQESLRLTDSDCLSGCDSQATEIDKTC